MKAELKINDKKEVVVTTTTDFQKSVEPEVGTEEDQEVVWLLLEVQVWLLPRESSSLLYVCRTLTIKFKRNGDKTNRQ